MILLYIILFAIIVYFIFFVSQFFNLVLKGYAPFISTDSETIKEILNEVYIDNNFTIFELGSG
jgi:hypothetical protein